MRTKLPVILNLVERACLIKSGETSIHLGHALVFARGARVLSFKARTTTSIRDACGTARKHLEKFMRTTKDRIRHAIYFEIIGLIFAMPLGAWVFGMPMSHIGVVAIVSSTIATVWNYIYNLLFDFAMLRIMGDVRKTLIVRIIHTVLFEVGLMAVLMPFIAWYLRATLYQAFLMDFSFTLFYLIYAFVYNWVYDIVFPVPMLNTAVK
jgi:uncharacterized membrane protein